MKALRGISCVVALAIASQATAAIKVACVGDSITAGIGTSGGNSYPAVLGRMLGAGYQVGNYGDSGSTALKLPQSTSYWITPAFTGSQSFAPEVVVIMLGTNDSKTNNWKGGNNAFEADYRALVKVYAGLPGQPRIYAALPPPALTSNFTIDGQVIANQIIPIIRKVAADAGVSVIDVNGAFNPDPRKYFGAGNGTDIGDGIHPNNAGAAAIAGAVARGLTQGTVDAGVADASADARVAEDATGPEAGRDAGLPDTGIDVATMVAADASREPDVAQAAPDAARQPDSRGPGGAGGGEEPVQPEPTRPASGKRGGCAVGERPSSAGLALLVLLVALRRRRP